MQNLQWVKMSNPGEPGLWRLRDAITNEQIAWAQQRDGDAIGQIRNEKPHMMADGVHRLRQNISKAVDRRSIGLFGDDNVTFLPSKSWRD